MPQSKSDLYFYLGLSSCLSSLDGIRAQATDPGIVWTNRRLSVSAQNGAARQSFLLENRLTVVQPKNESRRENVLE
jgi:hypothetical protein